MKAEGGLNEYNFSLHSRLQSTNSVPDNSTLLTDFTLSLYLLQPILTPTTCFEGSSTLFACVDLKPHSHICTDFTKSIQGLFIAVFKVQVFN